MVLDVIARNESPRRKTDKTVGEKLVPATFLHPVSLYGLNNSGPAFAAVVTREGAWIYSDIPSGKEEEEFVLILMRKSCVTTWPTGQTRQRLNQRPSHPVGA